MNDATFFAMPHAHLHIFLAYKPHTKPETKKAINCGDLQYGYRIKL